MLDVRFPTPQQAGSEGAEAYAVECAVCYMYDLDGCVPEIACDGCQKPCANPPPAPPPPRPTRRPSGITTFPCPPGGGALPSASAPSARYHKSCLCEWLRALPSTRQSFNRLFGECPYCSKPITVEAG